MQQILFLEKDKAALKILAAHAYENFIRTNSVETIDHTN